MIWAALSGVPCIRSCPLMANTLSLFFSFPSLAARPPGKRSRIKTPLSSDLRMSLMPSASVRWVLVSITWRTLPVFGLGGALPSGLREGWGAADAEEEAWWSERWSLILKPFSCMTVSLRRDACCNTAMAREWGTEARLMSFTWKHNTRAVNQRRHYKGINTVLHPVVYS